MIFKEACSYEAEQRRNDGEYEPTLMELLEPFSGYLDEVIVTFYKLCSDGYRSLRGALVVLAEEYLGYEIDDEYIATVFVAEALCSVEYPTWAFEDVSDFLEHFKSKSGGLYGLSDEEMGLLRSFIREPQLKHERLSETGLTTIECGFTQKPQLVSKTLFPDMDELSELAKPYLHEKEYGTFRKTDLINTCIHGDSLDVLRQMPAGVYDGFYTSTPYLRKRLYASTYSDSAFGGETYRLFGGREDCDHKWIKDVVQKTKSGEVFNLFCPKCHGYICELGQEATCEQFIEHLSEYFEELYRVLKPGATGIINIDESWSADRKLDGYTPSKQVRHKEMSFVLSGLDDKLRKIGYAVRGVPLWEKDRVHGGYGRDRFRHSYEYLIHVTKPLNNNQIPTTYFNDDELRVPLKDSSLKRLQQNVEGQAGSQKAYESKKVKAYAPEDGKRMARDIIRCNSEGYSGQHQAVGSLKLAKLITKAFFKEGSLLLDPFGGVGTFAMAFAENRCNFTTIEVMEESYEESKMRLRKYIEGSVFARSIPVSDREPLLALLQDSYSC